MHEVLLFSIKIVIILIVCSYSISYEQVWKLILCNALPTEHMMNPLNKDSPFSHVYFRSTKVIPHRKWEVYGKWSEIGVNPCIVFISYFSNRDFLHFRDIWLEGVSAEEAPTGAA